MVSSQFQSAVKIKDQINNRKQKRTFIQYGHIGKRDKDTQQAIQVFGHSKETVTGMLLFITLWGSLAIKYSEM